MDVYLVSSRSEAIPQEDVSTDCVGLLIFARIAPGFTDANSSALTGPCSQEIDARPKPIIVVPTGCKGVVPKQHRLGDAQIAAVVANNKSAVVGSLRHRE